MIASVLRLSRADCKNLGIRDAYGIHKAVYTLFPKMDEQSRDFLYADQGGDFHLRQILILSHRAPEIPEIGIVESKQISSDFLNHLSYGFTIRLNPTKRDKVTGKTIAVRGHRDQGISDRQAIYEWFVAKAPSWGFDVDPSRLQIQDMGIQVIDKGDAKLTHGYAVFQGQLRVLDLEKFRQSFENGIGRAKSFGFGLLQIVPLKA